MSNSHQFPLRPRDAFPLPTVGRFVVRSVTAMAAAVLASVPIAGCGERPQAETRLEAMSLRFMERGAGGVKSDPRAAARAFEDALLPVPGDATKAQKAVLELAGSVAVRDRAVLDMAEVSGAVGEFNTILTGLDRLLMRRSELLQAAEAMRLARRASSDLNELQEGANRRVIAADERVRGAERERNEQQREIDELVADANRYREEAAALELAIATMSASEATTARAGEDSAPMQQWRALTREADAYYVQVEQSRAELARSQGELEVLASIEESERMRLQRIQEARGHLDRTAALLADQASDFEAQARSLDQDIVQAQSAAAALLLEPIEPAYLTATGALDRAADAAGRSRQELSRLAPMEQATTRRLQGDSLAALAQMHLDLAARLENVAAAEQPVAGAEGFTARAAELRAAAAEHFAAAAQALQQSAEFWSSASTPGGAGGGMGSSIHERMNSYRAAAGLEELEDLGGLGDGGFEAGEGESADWSDENAGDGSGESFGDTEGDAGSDEQDGSLGMDEG